MNRAIYGSEIVTFFLKGKRRFLKASLVFSLFTFAATLFFSTPHYRAHATFFQGNTETGELSSLKAFLQNFRSNQAESSAAVLMQSRTLLSEVVEEMGLQMEPLKKGRLSSRFQLIGRELGRSSHKEPFLFRQLSYQGDTARVLFIKPLSPDSFEIFGKKRQKLATGKLGEQVEFEGISLIVSQVPKSKRKTAFSLIPKQIATQKLKKKLSIKTSRIDSKLINLYCKHSNRSTALGILEVMMGKYQNYLQAQHKQISTSQLAYLEKKQDELAQKFDHALEEHANYLRSAQTTEGFLGLSQEVAMLSYPKTQYTSRKHELDLQGQEHRKQNLEASSTHPWADGIERKHELEWEEAKWGPAILPQTDEFVDIDLETAKHLHQGYTQKKDQLFLEVAELEKLQNKLDDPSFSLNGLSQTLTDPYSQSILEKGGKLSLMLSDTANRSEKELDRLKTALSEQRGFLQSHLSQKIDLLKLKIGQTETKIDSLQSAIAISIAKEKALVEEKLKQLSLKMNELPEKWQMESRLKMQRDQLLQIIEGVTAISEAKALNHHLFHVTSKPLDLPQAPSQIAKPHLFAFSLAGGLIGGVFFFALSLFQAALRGLPLSKEALQDFGYRFIDGKTFQTQELWKQLFLKVESHNVTSLVGNCAGLELARLCVKNNMKLLRVEVGEQSEVTPFQDHHLVKVKTLLGKEIKQTLSSWKREFDCILIIVKGQANSAEALASTKWSDQTILFLEEENESVLAPFAKEKLLCVLKN